MDDATKAKIAALSNTLSEKRLVYENMRIMNVPSDFEERKKQDADFAIAKAEYFKALHHYDHAIWSISPNPQEPSAALHTPRTD